MAGTTTHSRSGDQRGMLSGSPALSGASIHRRRSAGCVFYFLLQVNFSKGTNGARATLRALRRGCFPGPAATAMRHSEARVPPARTGCENARSQAPADADREAYCADPELHSPESGAAPAATAAIVETIAGHSASDQE